MVRAVGAGPGLNQHGMGATSHPGLEQARDDAGLDRTRGPGHLSPVARNRGRLVENYQAGSLDRLGLGYEDLRKINPGLIYCSVSGYGHRARMLIDPATMPQSRPQADPSRPSSTAPAGEMVIGPSIFDYATGAMAAFAIGSALFRRERTGQAQRWTSPCSTPRLYCSAPTSPICWRWRKLSRQMEPSRPSRLPPLRNSGRSAMAGASTGNRRRVLGSAGKTGRAVDALGRSIADLETAPLDVIEHAQRVLLTKPPTNGRRYSTGPRSRPVESHTQEAVTDPQIAHVERCTQFDGPHTHWGRLSPTSMDRNRISATGSGGGHGRNSASASAGSRRDREIVFSRASPEPRRHRRVRPGGYVAAHSCHPHHTPSRAADFCANRSSSSQISSSAGIAAAIGSANNAPTIPSSDDPISTDQNRKQGNFQRD